MTVERSIRNVERTAREHVERDPEKRESFRMSNYRTLSLVGHQVEAAEELEAKMAADPRFEWMKKREIEEAVWDLAEAANAERAKSHLDGFVEQHAREPERLECWFPVEGLTVPRTVGLPSAKLVPADETELPEFVAQYPPAMHAAIVAGCVGSNRREMMKRARKIAEHGLRVLRVALAGDMGIIDQQLRFRLGTVYWFSEGSGGGGWGSRQGEIIKLELPEDLLTTATSTLIAELPAEGGTKVEQAARRAARWFEASQLETDPLNETLFLFFALEAMLGDKSERLKAEGLALRRAVLSHKVTTHFTHPGRIYSLYGAVRSAAVHGTAVPEVPNDAVRAFSRDVRAAIGEFLEFARSGGFDTRGKLLRALDDALVRERIKDFLPT